MGVKGNGQRIFILVIVVVFFLTSVAFTAFVIFDSSNSGNLHSNNNADIQEQIQELQNQEQTGENMLQGTKLVNFEPIAEVTELKVIDIKEGDGEVVPEGARVNAHYTGALASDGTIFQSSYDTGSPIPFGLNEVIAGWTEGVPGMKVGGERRIIIPAEKAYAGQERPGIPPNSDLVFDIVIVGIENE